MAASTEQLNRLRRMIAEPQEETYTDADLLEYLSRYPLIDANGNEPDDSDWDTTSLDLNAVAAEIWQEKAAVFAADFDFSVDNGSYKLSQAYTQCMKMAAKFHSRASITTIEQIVWPVPRLQDAWIGNLATVEGRYDLSQ